MPYDYGRNELQGMVYVHLTFTIQGGRSLCDVTTAIQPC